MFILHERFMWKVVYLVWCSLCNFEKDFPKQLNVAGSFVCFTDARSLRSEVYTDKLSEKYYIYGIKK